MIKRNELIIDTDIFKKYVEVLSNEDLGCVFKHIILSSHGIEYFPEKTEAITYCKLAYGVINLNPKNKPHTIYLCKVNNKFTGEEFLKIGFTIDIESRFNSMLDYIDVKFLDTIQLNYKKVALKNEKELHKSLSEYSYLPSFSFGGKTECYSISYINEVCEKFNELKIKLSK